MTRKDHVIMLAVCLLLAAYAPVATAQARREDATPATLQELVERAARFVLVTFTTDHSREREIIPTVARVIIAGLGAIK